MDNGQDKTTVRVTIFQQPYTLRTSGEPGETEALAHLVDEIMTQIATHGAGSDPTRVAVLTSLHLADRVRGLERKLDRNIARIHSCDERLAKLLEISQPSE